MTWSQYDIVVLPCVLAGIIAFCIGMYFIGKKVSLKTKRIIMLLIPAIMLALEVYKQIRAIVIGYTLWTLPFHFSSWFMVWFALAEFSKEGSKVRRAGQAVSMVACIIFIIVFYINPPSVIGNASQTFFTDFLKAHTFIYHHFFILYFGLTIAFKTYIPKFKDIISTLILLVIYFTVGITAAYSLNTNFGSLLSNVMFLEDMRLAVGQVLYTIIFFLIGVVAATLITFVISLIPKIFSKNK